MAATQGERSLERSIVLRPVIMSGWLAGSVGSHCATEDTIVRSFTAQLSEVSSISLTRPNRTAAARLRVRDPAGHKVRDIRRCRDPARSALGRLLPGFVLERDAKLRPIRDPAVLR